MAMRRPDWKFLHTGPTLPSVDLAPFRRLPWPSAAVVLELLGIVAIAGGVAVIWWPAGLIVGGLSAVLIAQGMAKP